MLPSFGSATPALALACGLGLLTSVTIACATTQDPGPQQASFAPGDRTASSGPLALELSAARYDLRQVSLQLTLDNRGTLPLHIEREGILLTYDGLEYPVSPEAAAVPERATLDPGASMDLELSFVTEQALLEAATLRLLSIREGDDGWLAPLQVAVPPSATFVDSAAQPVDEE